MITNYFRENTFLEIIKLRIKKLSKTHLIKIMRTSLMLICFFILAWQGLVITNTLKTRLEERTNQVETLLNQI